MSTGFICDCTAPNHPPRVAEGATGCGRYAADQELGGPCSSCSTGWHLPCDRPWFSPGSCLRCGWHGTQHAQPGDSVLR
jgi:hypothetical protein